MSAITVMQSAAFKEAFLSLTPQFERATGHVVSATWVASARILPALQSGGVADLVITSAAGVDALIAEAVADERVDLATCGVGVAVRAGAARPDLSSGEALKRSVLAAGRIVYSRGPSGIYLDGLFERMGIASAIEAKVIRVQGEPAGEVVARGEADLGFQQMCELMPVAGIDVVGPLPPDVQEITTFSATVLKRSKAPDVARQLIDYFRSEEAKIVIRKTGMDPV